ncbi:MAG TPA: Holliday junction resolvase RecU [Bacilli bacterium]|nr:Holliday junction resolvase RecU [Bacilli bacterium]
MAIKYPNPDIQLNKKSNIRTHGMLFENSLNLSNEYYLAHNIAIVHKKPTPVQVVKVDYPSRSQARISEAYYKQASTTDYNGIYRGKYIDYEAKETVNLSFSFKHIFEHQIIHLTKVQEHGGIAFVIIYFKKVNEIYIINISDFLTLMKNGFKSITIEKAKELGKLVNQGYAPLINYLKAVDEMFF